MASLAPATADLPPINNTVYESESDDDDDDDDDGTVDTESTTQTANRTAPGGDDGDGGGNISGGESEDLLAIRQQAFDLLNKSGGPASREDQISWPTDPQLLDEIQQQQQAARRYAEEKLFKEQQQEEEEKRRLAKKQKEASSSSLKSDWREKLAQENKRQSRLRAKIGSSPQNSPTRTKYETKTNSKSLPAPTILQAGGGAASSSSSSSSYHQQSAGESAGREGLGGTSSYKHSGYQSSSSSPQTASMMFQPHEDPNHRARVAHESGDLSVTELFTNCVSSICKSTMSYAQQTDVMSVISQSYQSISGMNMEQQMNGSYDTIDTSHHGYGNRNNNQRYNNGRSATGNRYGGYTDGNSHNNFRGRYSD